MGRRGPAPAPKELLRLQGSWRGRVKGQGVSPPSSEGPPHWPQCLMADRAAHACWRHLLARLRAMGILAGTDRQALVRYCRLWSRWLAAERFLLKHGEHYALKNDHGEGVALAEWPQVARAISLSAELTRLEDRLGLSPSARSRIVVEPNRPTAGGKARFFQDGAG